MPEIQAFRGLRYDLGHVGNLSDVVAPPYDVISPELQEQLYKKHPANIVRLILNREEPGDDQQNNQYLRAARFLRNWRQEGVFQREPDPAVYVYDQVFSWGGRRLTRRGFMARVRLEPFGQGTIYPHEETHSAAKADRLRLTVACNANLSQIFGIYPDPGGDVSPLLKSAVAGQLPLVATDHLSVEHHLWPITDVRFISDLTAAMSGKPLFVADGHHRYETACNYRDQLAAAEGPLKVNHPANFVLMMCISMADPGLVVLPTHRLFRGLPALSSSELVRRLGDCFTVRQAGEGPHLAETVWTTIESEGRQETLGLYASGDNRWILARITPTGRARLAAAAKDHCAAWQSLGVSILHRLLIETLLGATRLPEPRYVHRVDELAKCLMESDGAQPFPLAALVLPATLEHIRSVSTQGERLPAKSTYFYPKLLSGLVINPLEP